VRERERDCASLFTTSFNAQPLETGPAGGGTLAEVSFSANLVFYFQNPNKIGGILEKFISLVFSFFKIDVKVKSAKFANLFENYSPNFRNLQILRTN
jgi:hypothetical protein